MMFIAILDLGIGNLRSIKRGLEFAGAKTKIISASKDLSKADSIVLPGVGAFEDAFKNLKPLKEILFEEISSGKPVLGICLGMQLMFEESTEGGLHKGLGIFKGKVVRFPKLEGLKIPQMGWNSLEILKKDPIIEGIEDDSYVYFVHSYYPNSEERAVAKTSYGVDFPSIVSKKEQIFATQFHPEKSGKIGLKILENFVKIIKR
nr:imidazole glycerol phosphate synthase subunit HisH [Candidatus Wukongarchaeota archaeon]